MTINSNNSYLYEFLLSIIIYFNIHGRKNIKFISSLAKIKSYFYTGAISAIYCRNKAC